MITNSSILLSVIRIPQLKKDTSFSSALVPANTVTLVNKVIENRTDFLDNSKLYNGLRIRENCVP